MVGRIEHLVVPDDHTRPEVYVDLAILHGLQ